MNRGGLRVTRGDDRLTCRDALNCRNCDKGNDIISQVYHTSDETECCSFTSVYECTTFSDNLNNLMLKDSRSDKWVELERLDL